MKRRAVNRKIVLFIAVMLYSCLCMGGRTCAQGISTENIEGQEMPGNPEESGSQAEAEEPGEEEGKPEKPGNPGKEEGEPEKPGNPEDPGEEGKPEEPGNPEDPENPGNSENPEEPGNPEDPGNGSEGAGNVIETAVSGMKMSYEKTAASEIRDTITITPGDERTVSLQMYQPSSGEWKKKCSFSTGIGDGRVTLVYPKAWKKANTSLWRIVIDAKDGCSGYISDPVTITTRNRKELNLKARSALIMEMESGQIFYGKSMNTRRPNASTTKIMTAILALEKKKLNSKVRITAEAVYTPYSVLGTRALNDRASMKQLLYLTLLPSDNGAATALAIHTGGSVKNFAKMMNQKAKELGCTNTSFKNPHGLHAKKHYTSAKDLALITRYAMGNKTFRKIVNTRFCKFRTKKKKNKYAMYSTNRLLGEVDGICGVKTGFTNQAQNCFSGAYKYNGKTYITIVLGSPGIAACHKDTKRLISYINRYM